MFIEPYITGSPKGWIEVICGGMFSGKTEELIRRLKRARIANLKVEIFKPATDNRYAINEVVSHDANQIPSVVVHRALDILSLVEEKEVVGIDEAQFFAEEIRRLEAKVFEEQCKRAAALKQFAEYCEEEDD